ncbi:MAG: hypothetical protein LAP21_02005 [Acidobacteriia bacterium]|nr:hypothetical protein [Terriglobia bacterium]
MKKVLAGILLAGLLTISAAAQKPAAGKKATGKTAAADTSKSIDAWVSDERCGTNVDAACAKRCMDAGAKLVVVNAADNSVIPVSNQASVKPFAGQHVTIKGKLENGSLMVASVKPFEAPKK